MSSPEIFDEYTRRQYVAKAPERNPFGTEEEPAKFAEFDIFTKVILLSAISSNIPTNGNPLDKSPTTAYSMDLHKPRPN
jgi:hypothetical protein